MYKIKYYQLKFKDAVIQGSKEWYEHRKTTFGGSEIAQVLNKHKIKANTFEALVQKKKTLDPEKEVVYDALWWGKIFEPIVKHMLEDTLKRKIYDFGSIIHPYVPISYTPDGLYLNEKEDDIVLLEIKTPIRRHILDKDGNVKVPPEYMFQVQTGLSIFHASHCDFVQVRFRRCPIQYMNEPFSFDRNYHKDFVKREHYKACISFGYFIWKCETCPTIIDLSSVDNMVDTLKESHLNIYDYILIMNEHIEKHKLPNGFILGWKCFNIVHKEIKPQKDFLSTYEKELWEKYKILTE